MTLDIRTTGRIIMMQNSGKVMVEVIDLDSQRPHEFYEAMCAKCLDRWLAVVMVGVVLKDVVCKNCGPGFVIRTGQPIEMEDNNG